MAVQTVASKLSSEIWREMAIQSPENTIYSASTQKTKGRRNIMDMAWNQTQGKPELDRPKKNFPKVNI